MEKKIEETVREFSDSIRRTKIRLLSIWEEEERRKRAESKFKEIIAENFPHLGKELNIQVHEAN